jgi:hypothetical protein
LNLLLPVAIIVLLAGGYTYFLRLKYTSKRL